jgi:hypothetical protein
VAKCPACWCRTKDVVLRGTNGCGVWGAGMVGVLCRVGCICEFRDLPARRPLAVAGWLGLRRAIVYFLLTMSCLPAQTVRDRNLVVSARVLDEAMTSHRCSYKNVNFLTRRKLITFDLSGFGTYRNPSRAKFCTPFKRQQRTHATTAQHQPGLAPHSTLIGWVTSTHSHSSSDVATPHPPTHLN